MRGASDIGAGRRTAAREARKSFEKITRSNYRGISYSSTLPTVIPIPTYYGDLLAITVGTVFLPYSNYNSR